MNATEWVLRLVRDAAPAPSAVAAAAAQLDRFHRASAAGQAPSALTGLAAGATDPLWTAWVSGAAAAAGSDAELAWIPVCAATVALADDQRTTTAIALGYQVAERVAAALDPEHGAAGWDTRATAGLIGAGAAAGWLCELDETALRHALGLCATQACGLSTSTGTDAEPLQLGKAAGNAVEAVLLAQCGFTSSTEPLEGRRGMFAAMSASDSDMDWS